MSASAIVIVDATGRISAWSASARLLFGYADAEVVGKSVGTLVGDEQVLLEDLLTPTTPEHDSGPTIQLLAARRDLTVFQCELTSTAFDQGQGAYWVLVFRDVAERSSTEEALQRSEDKYRALAVNAPVGIFETNAAGECVFVNRAWTEISGLRFEEALGHGWTHAIHPQDLPRVVRVVAEAEAHNAPFQVDYRFGSDGARQAFVHAAGVPLRNAAGVQTGYMGTAVDMTERRQTLEALAQSENNFRSLVERAPFGVVVTRDLQIVYANQSFLEMLGVDDVSLLAGRSFVETLIHPDARKLALVRQAAREAGALLPPVAVRALRPDGRELFVENSSASLMFDGLPSHVFAVRDVTDRERAEQVRQTSERAMRDSLREKEVLLKEVHHRVKNNLQVIVSLINLQAGKVEDPALRVVFEETRSRVHAIALLHERLYGSRNLGHIDMRDYLVGLASDLSSTNLDPRPIALHVDAEELYFEMDAAVPIGLIVNELVTNAYKHAFPRGKRSGGTIVVLLRRVEESIEIVVRDDGVGYPDNLDPEVADSLGLLLISSLSGQLEGRVHFDHRDDGAECVVRFPKRTTPGSQH